jgi:hypothetical protein
MSDRASAEILLLSTPPDLDGHRGREPATCDRLMDAGRLSTRAMDSNALVDAFVEAATHLRDADASCVALAGVLAVPLLTDDAKERRVARQLFPSIELLTTLDLLHGAVESLGLADPEVLELVVNLRWRGNFAPPTKDPRREWYSDLLRRAGVAPP